MADLFITQYRPIRDFAEAALLVTEPTAPTGPLPQLVKEGLVYKIGETIRNWRPRYFYLFDDGAFLCFKQSVENPLTLEPLDNFSVTVDCQITKMESPKPSTFKIRGLFPIPEVERKFYADSELERQQWMDALETVALLIERYRISG